ncbi:MAG: hypothetical protein WC119_00920 [Synergistaceae bacterium]
METKQTEHTAGNWEAGKAYAHDKNSWYAVVFAPQKTGRTHSPRVAEALGLTREEAEANAKFIAKSPEMLKILNWLEKVLSNGAIPTNESAWDMAERIRKVIE